MTPEKTGPKRRVTAYDVAQLAGVSQSAVSRSMNAGSVSPEVRARVVKAARALAYRPNIMARAVTTRQSNLVAIIMFDETNLHFPEVLNELVEAFSARGVRVLLLTLQTEDNIDAMVEQVWAYQVDGVVAAARLSPEQVAQFAEHQVPVVIYNRAPARGVVSSVGCDHHGGGQMLADLLAGAGHRRFALIHGPKASPVGEERIAGVRDRLTALGLTDIAEIEGDYSYDSGRAAIIALAARQPLTDCAVVAASDWMALGALDGARHELGLEAPRDLSIVGFDGIAQSAWSSYRLTTIRQPVRDMARAAAAMVLAGSDEPAGFVERRLFSGTLALGATSRPARPTAGAR